jgi:hypothetical protein
VTTKEHACRMIDAHESAAARTKSSLKISQHLLAATLLRQQFGISAAVSFGERIGSTEAKRKIQDEIEQFKNR